MKTDGFSNWSRVSTTAWVFNQFFEFDIVVAALFDRDYRCDAEVIAFKEKLLGKDVNCHVLPCKEIENILLVPRAICAVVDRYKTIELENDWQSILTVKLESIVAAVPHEVLAKRIGARINYELSQNGNIDVATVSTAESADFNAKWESPKFRYAVVPGKSVFSKMAKFVQDEYKVTLTSTRTINELEVLEVQPEIFEILSDLKSFFG